MSFCSDIKTELTAIRVSRCCMQALTYGLLLFGRAFSANKISMQSENEAVTRLYSTLIQKNMTLRVKEQRARAKTQPIVQRYLMRLTDLKF